MTNPKAHAPNATQRRYKAKPIRAVPSKPEKRPADAHWNYGEHHLIQPPTYRLTRNGLEVIGLDPAIHGEPAERPAPAWDERRS